MQSRKSTVSTDYTDYHHFTDVTLRYSDTDKLGHVNNAVFATLFESGRVAIMPEDDISKAGETGVFVLASIKIDFKAELHIPGIAQVGTTVAEFGSASLSFHQALFKDGVCCATAEAVAVFIDERTRKPKRISPLLKERLLAYGQPQARLAKTHSV
jgi:acyl-CoA thioester hydrolase